MVIVVADGAGGMGGGGRASDLAVKTVLDAVAAGSLDGLSSQACAALLRTADALVTEEREAGETTMVLVVVTAEGRVVGASCGDSGALIVTEGRLDDVTDGQGRWRLGSGHAEPVGFERPALRGTLLVATDGLLAYVRPDTPIGLVERHDAVDAAAAALAQAAKLPRGGLQDDLALVVLRAE